MSILETIAVVLAIYVTVFAGDRYARA